MGAAVPVGGIIQRSRRIRRNRRLVRQEPSHAAAYWTYASTRSSLAGRAFMMSSFQVHLHRVGHDRSDNVVAEALTGPLAARLAEPAYLR